MEDGLVRMVRLIILQCLPRLNPCCNGRWSRTFVRRSRYYNWRYVLILVVMEDGLVQTPS